MKRPLILLITGLLSFAASAQKLTVESMTLAGNDISASKYERKDLTGSPCALVKVLLPSLGVKFEGNVIQPVEYKTGEYWVYMSAGSQELRIKHPQTQPLHVKFSDYNIKKITSKTTYNLSILMPEIEEGVAMAKAGEPLLPDWLNSSQPNRWIGISPPTTDRKKARSAAIINAVLGYMRANKEGKSQISIQSEIENNYTSGDKITTDVFAEVTYDKFNCEISNEYYNSRGEYFVRCGFVSSTNSRNELKIRQSISHAQQSFGLGQDREDVEFSRSIVNVSLVLDDCRFSGALDMGIETSHDSLLSISVKINSEPLIPVYDFTYNKCQWNQTGEGGVLSFLPDETRHSLGSATFSVYGLLPFVPKALKCMNKTDITNVSYQEEGFSNYHGLFKSTADTICSPIPIRFMTLSGNGLTMQIGHVNFQEKEIGEWYEHFDDEQIDKRRLLERSSPFDSAYRGGAITRLIRTYSALINTYGLLANKFNTQVSSVQTNDSTGLRRTDRLTNELELHNIGIRWNFENMPTSKQERMILRQATKIKNFSRWPSLWIAGEEKRQKKELLQ